MPLRKKVMARRTCATRRHWRMTGPQAGPQAFETARLNQKSEGFKTGEAAQPVAG
jgi:hypothetical protein